MVWGMVGKQGEKRKKVLYDMWVLKLSPLWKLRGTTSQSVSIINFPLSAFWLFYFLHLFFLHNLETGLWKW
jgi:hypothetical protein